MSSVDELVVVGYGVQKKVNLTGSVSAIDFESENMESRPLQNMSTALSGMAAGLNVNQQNGKPSGGASIQVRGIGSLNSSQSPLIIIDGQVGDLNSVNPNDVASVSVLKDAASAAIYGSRASNGVILITTKTGAETDGKVSFNYTGNTGFTQAAHLFDVVSSTVDQMELINLVQRNSGINPSYSEERIQEWRERSISDPLLFPNTDWWDAILQNGQITNHNVSARGGNERVNFFTSLGYLNNEGIITNTGYRKFNFRNNITYKVNEWLELGNIITAQIGNDDPASINGIFQWFETLTPGTLPKHPDGRYGISMTGGSEFSQNNPLLSAETALGEINSQRYTGKLFANVTPIEGLKITGSYFIDMLNSNNWSSSIPVDRWNFQENSIAVPAGTNIGLQNAFSKGQRHVIDLFADYNISFAEHNFGLILGYNQEYFRNDSFNANKTDLISIDVPVLNAAATLVSAGGNSNDFALRSYFGRVTYNLKEKYLIEANMRMDGSSRFSPDNRWGIFPSFSAGWIISNEAFWGDFNNIIDFLKIRTSYGRLGNNGIGNYDWQAVYQAANYSFNGQIVKGITTNAYANSNITWETTDVFNFATDLSLPWNLSLSLDYYNKLTHGILSRIPIPFVNGGLAAPLINSAKVKNTGIEAEINYRTDIQDISINFSINGSYNNNKIEEYKGDYLEPHGVGVWTEGQPIGKYWLRQVDRIVQVQDEIDQLLEQGWEFSPSTPGPGDFLYKDTDGNTIVNDGDRVLMGNPIPLYTYGGNFSIAYKGIDLFAQFNGVAAWDKYFSSIVFK